MQKNYTIEEINNLAENNGFSLTFCDEEKTIQVALDMDSPDYFGEFFETPTKGYYGFNFYNIN